MDEKRRSKGTILIVDDEPNVVWFISKVVHPMGYETVAAGTGTEAVRYVQEFGDKIDLVLLDLRMPEMDGISVLKSIRRFRKNLPVIILTALHDKREECEALGIEAFIRKPYSLENLYEKIEQVIDREAQEPPAAVALDPHVEAFARILIVDNSTEVCELLSSVLFEDVSDARFEVKWVRSGEEALEASHEFEPDIGIIDIKLPRMWGDELVRRFKAGEGRCPRDFIIYSNVVDPDALARARKLGHSFLSKATDLDALVETLKGICFRHNLLRKKQRS